MKPYIYNYWIKQNVVLYRNNTLHLLDNTRRKREKRL